MTKTQALSTIKLLSAMESWAFSTKTPLPDYLLDNLQSCIDVLERIVLSEAGEARAPIDALYKHGFQIQDDRDALRAEVEQFKAQSDPQPLTDESIRRIEDHAASIIAETLSPFDCLKWVVRQTEAAHNIK